eukprot:217333_1
MATSPESKEGINEDNSLITSSDSIEIKVGNSNQNTKIITLPTHNMTVSPIPMNKQNPNWNDTFSVKIEGNKLFVTRIDCKQGWGQNLILQATKQANGILFGRWKCLVFINSKYWGCHDINCYKHSSQGVIEAELIGTQNPGKEYIIYQNKSKYIGVKKEDSVTLTYIAHDNKYTASIILTINEFSMDGSWHDSTNGSGTVQWIKAQKLKQN